MVVTLSEIAKRTGVSIAVVSKVVNNSTTNSGVAKKTAVRVKSVANEMGYLPNVAARMLISGKTDVIGILAPHGEYLSQHYYLARLFDEISVVLDKKTKHMMHIDGDRLQLTSVGLPRVIKERRIDGVIIVDVHKFDNMRRTLEEFKIPWVGITSFPYYLENCIFPNSRVGMTLATRYLLGLGHKKLAYAHYDIPRSNEEMRYVGIEAAVNNADATVSFVASPYHSGDSENFTRTWKTLITELFPSDNRQDWPTAVICDLDWIAIAVMRAAREIGLTVPKDLSVIGQGNGPEEAFAEPSLTTIVRNGVGTSAIEMLLERIENGKKIKSREIAPSLIERCSTGPVPE